MTQLDPSLAELARRYGVATDFHDWQGRHVTVPVATVRAVLAALGVEAGTPEQARAALHAEEEHAWRRMLPPTVVIRAGQRAEVRVHVDHGDPVELWVELEDGGTRHDLVQLDRWVDPREVGGRVVGCATFALPVDLPLGWHRLHASSRCGTAEGALAVTPAFLGVPGSLGRDRVWGFTTQLYQVRSRASWGLGDLGDLAQLVRWSGGDLGAGFVLVNPLHAANPVPPMESSPYLPATRRFVNPVYVRVEDVPEHAALGEDARARVERLAAPLQERSGTDEELERDLVWAAKKEALALVHAVPRSRERQAAFEDFLAREGQGLVDFATWCVLAEVHGLPWREWPEALRDPGSSAVADVREEHADRVDFYCWLQWVLDDQLSAAQAAAAEAGMPLGVVHDLAVGVHADGADTWSLQGVLASGVSVGAPPDAYNQQGQDWSQPPWRPDALAATGYAAYRDMLRTVLRHAGGIRVDHIIGLFRLWWVPAGAGPTEGTYVRYDHEALVGILALEAHRAGAVVVGEDLGTVEPWVRDYLAERGILGTSILWFERDGSGRPLPPEWWRELCLASVTTHDLPPTAGYLAGEHITVRHELGVLTRSIEEERRVDAEDREAWLQVLRDRGLLTDGAGERETVEALHRLLAAAPSRLLGVALADAVGDRRSVNYPGTSMEYPNWRVPLADADRRPVVLDELVESGRARALAAALRPVGTVAS